MLFPDGISSAIWAAMAWVRLSHAMVCWGLLKAIFLPALWRRCWPIHALTLFIVLFAGLGRACRLSRLIMVIFIIGCIAITPSFLNPGFYPILLLGLRLAVLRLVFVYLFIFSMAWLLKVTLGFMCSFLRQQSILLLSQS